MELSILLLPFLLLLLSIESARPVLQAGRTKRLGQAGKQFRTGISYLSSIPLIYLNHLRLAKIKIKLLNYGKYLPTTPNGVLGQSGDILPFKLPP